MRKLIAPFLCALLLLLAGCSQTPNTAEKKEAEKPPEPVTGQSALYKCYQVARSWAPDLQVLTLASRHLTDIPTPPPGKAGAWDATFTSATRAQARSYIYSILEELPMLHKGVFGGPTEGWSGPHGIEQPFPIIAVKTDSDAAYQTALKEGGADYDKKHPGLTISVLLEKTTKFPDPAWRIIWGESAGTSNFSVFVDASTGEFLEKMH